MAEQISHIVYAADDRFAEILGVSLVSLYENSKDMEDIAVYVLDSGITEINKNRLGSIACRYKRQDIIFIKAKSIREELGIDVKVDRGSLTQYARLFVSSILPCDLERVIYLDCDVIILHSIKELWNLDLRGKTIAALMDAFSKYYRKNIGLSPNDVMFNSGVMVIDLKKWKAQRIEEKLLEFIKNRKGKIQQGDQGCLNSILSHDVYCFEPRFNAVTIFFDFTYEEMLKYRRPPAFYEKEEVKKAVNEPSIIHFTTSFFSKRVWVKGSEHKYVNEWLKYKASSPWKDGELWDDNRQWWKKVESLLLKKMPRNFVIRIASLLQIYGRPLRYYIMNKVN